MDIFNLKRRVLLNEVIAAEYSRQAKLHLQQISAKT